MALYKLKHSNRRPFNCILVLPGYIDNTLFLWLVCDSKYQPLCFTARYLICIFFLLFLLFVMVGTKDLASGYRESPNYNRPSIRCAEGQYQFICFLQNFASFFSFFRWSENTYSQFSRKVFNQFEKCSSSTKIVRLKQRLPHNLISIFQMENVSPRKTEKNVEYVRQYLIDFPQVFTKMIALCLAF